MFKSYIAIPFSIVVMLTLSSCSHQWSPFSSGEVWQTPYVEEQQETVLARSVDASGEETKVAVTMAGGGEIGLSSMDANDKLKMSRALDAATGKTTSWTNPRTNIKYSVTPIKKVIIENNPFCRRYQATAEQGSYKKDSSGVACVMTDGSWHTVN